MQVMTIGRITWTLITLVEFFQEASSQNNSVTLTVEIINGDSVSAIEGQPITLTCRVLGTGTISVTWFGPKELSGSKYTIIPYSSNSSQSSLTISNLDYTDAGTYLCLARSSASSSDFSDTVTLAVTAPHSVDITTGLTVTGTPGLSVTFTCRVTGSGTITVIWIGLKGALLFTSSKYTVVAYDANSRLSNLTINSLTTSDAGTYSCRGSDSSGNTLTDTVQLIVTGGVIINFQGSNKVPKQGNSLQLSCLVDTTSNDGRYDTTWSSPTIVLFGKCYREQTICTGGSQTRQLTADENGSYLNIQVLNRSLDEGRWKCIYNGQGQIQAELSVTVYTIPSGLSFKQVPNMNVDLSVTSAQPQCTTSGCTYPPPLIQWLVQGQTASSPYEVYKTLNPTVSGSSCVSPEQIYTSTLDLQQNTTWSDNSDRIVIFSCRIEYPDSSMNLITSGSKTIRFAVRVTEAFLQFNNQNITSTLTVTSGEQITLTCVTGTSWPAPSIRWYLGSQSMGSITSLIFTPSNTDHSKVIYCQAYNIDPNFKVDSNKPSLFVKVRVTEAVLQQNGQTVSNATLIVTSGKPTILSCLTGNSRPDANIDWYIGSQKRGNGTSLNFIPTNDNHDKAIYCQAYNIDPNQPVMSNKPILFVRAAPKILDFSPSYKGYIGQYTIIQFDFYSNTKDNLTVTARHSNSSGLIHQGIILPIRPDDLQVYSSQIPAPVFRATLAISMKSTNDFGLYAIEVKNVIGSDSKDIKIIEQITPEKPLNFHASNIQEKQLSLTWQSGYHGGFTQTFVVEISLDNITWNNVSEVSAGNRDGWFSTVIEDLIPGSDYYLRLYAYNINGRGDYADVQLVIRMLKESAYPEVGATAGISVGGAVGISVGGIVLGLIAAIIAFTIRRQLTGRTNSCFRSRGKTDDEMQTYSNTEINPQTVKPIYEELNKENTERSVYDKISPL